MHAPLPPLEEPITAAAVVRRLQAVALQAQQDEECRAARAGLDFGIEMQVDEAAAGARVVLVDGPPGVRLAASAADWARILQPLPPVGWHSLAAASRQPGFVVQATPVQRAQALHLLERWFELARGQLASAAEEWPDLAALQGAYAQVALHDGRRAVLYHERSGDPARPPLLMLHTAGADARQFHALMADPGLQRDWSLHAFDMPAHGRSEPLQDEGWRGYRLGRAHYAGLCLAFVAQVLRRPAVVMGCSMGAAMALHLAREAPDWIRGAVALEAPLRSPGRRSPMLAHAQVNQAAHNPSYVRGLLAPHSPLALRRRAAWIYSQGGFGIYPGDLAFYSDEFDAERDVAGLDGRTRPVELLTGSYDHSATPADSAAVARLIPGAVFTEMPGLGHFPMTEHPAALLQHLRPALARVAARLA